MTLYTKYNGNVVSPEINVKYNNIVRRIDTVWTKYNGNLIKVYQCTPKKWDGVTTVQPLLVDGVYQIENCEHLAWFRDYVNAGNVTANAILIRDINLNNHDWIPIGESAVSTTDTYAGVKYSGTFNGDYHAITGLYINQPNRSYQGLFSYTDTSSTVSNISISGEVSGKAQIGSISGATNGTISQCITYCSNIIEYCDVNAGGGYAGGIVGCAGDNSIIIECIARCEKIGNFTTITNNTKHIAVGGIVGFTQNVISGCISICSEIIATADDAAYAGGIAGLAYAASYETQYIKDCISRCAKINSLECGGIIGWAYNIPITNCISECNLIVGRFTSGGITGSFSKDSSSTTISMLNCTSNNQSIQLLTGITIPPSYHSCGIGGMCGYGSNDFVNNLAILYELINTVEEYRDGAIIGANEYPRYSENYYCKANTTVTFYRSYGGTEVPATDLRPTSVILNLELTKGQKAATIYPTNYNVTSYPTTLTYTTDNPEVIDASGNALKKGTANVTVTATGLLGGTSYTVSGLVRVD